MTTITAPPAGGAHQAIEAPPLWGDDQTETARMQGAIAPMGDDGLRRVLVCAVSDRPAILSDDTYSWIDMAGLDLALLNSGRAPVLLDHYRTCDCLVGVVEQAWVEDGESCYAILRLAETEDATRIWSLVRGRFLCNVSIGFRGRYELEPGTRGARRWTRCLPFEISFVTLPCDWRCGIRAVPVPRRILERRAKAAADLAAGSRKSWLAWVPHTAERLASATPQDLPAALRSAVEDELDRLGSVAACRILTSA